MTHDSSDPLSRIGSKKFREDFFKQLQKTSKTSPLLNVAAGTKKTEKRRSRSRSRQRIESELAAKVDEIPVIHNTVEYLLSTYSLVKDSNPFLQSSLQRGEDVAFWMRQKTREVIEATNLDGPLKQMDSVAAKTLSDVEKSTRKMREQWESNNELWQNRMKAITKQWNDRTEGVQYTMFEAMQTIMDYIEESFEKVMIPPTPESAKFSEDPSFKMTVSRMVDMTYRFNAGVMTLSLNRVKEMGDVSVWINSAKPHVDPRQLRIRAQIISQEISAPQGKKLGYMENKELTELDRRLITTSRALRAASKNAVDAIGQGPNVAMTTMSNLWKYNRDLLKQLSEARNINDVTGIGLHETRRALEVAGENMTILKKSPVISKTVDWLATQEKKISK